MKKEYTLIFILGLFLLAYVLDAAVDPLSLRLATPYQFFQPQYVTQYPFTTASIIIKALGLFIAPLWLFSFMEKQFALKGVLLLVLAALMQLYALQDVVTKAEVVPIEWSLSISLAGVTLLTPMVLYIIRGIFASMHGLLTESQQEEPQEEKEEDVK